MHDEFLEEINIYAIVNLESSPISFFLVIENNK
jgi:hypothetical protein